MNAFIMPAETFTFEEVALWLSKELGRGDQCDSTGHSAHSRLRHFNTKPTNRSAAQFFQDLSELGKAVSSNRHLPRSIQLELRLFLTAWEHLLQHGMSPNGNEAQTRWAVASRFFVPWAASRLALHRLRVHKLPRWLTTRWNDLGSGSCFSRLVEAQRKNAGQKKSIWIAQAADRSKLDAESLRKALDRSHTGKCAISAYVLNSLCRGYSDQPRLCSQMILANAFDDALILARQSFGKDWTDHLLTFLGVCFKRFCWILSQDDVPSPQAEVLLWLQSSTISGNTPFDAEWLHPVISDPYLWEVAKKVKQDMMLHGGSRGLWELPTKTQAMGPWPRLPHLRLPDQLERALGSRDPMQLVNLTKKLFDQRRGRPKEMALVSRWLMVLLRTASIHQDELRQVVWQEVDRLLRLTLQRSKQGSRSNPASGLLRHLLQPDRPWHNHDATEAQSLLDELRPLHEKQGSLGQQQYLVGCLWLRINDRRKAVAAFGKALSCGRASVGSDWFQLLQDGLQASQGTSPRTEGRFRKLAEVEGLVGASRSPKAEAFMRGVEAGSDD